VAAAAECGVLGVGSRLPVACLTQQERLGLLRWVAACSPTDSTTKLQRDLAHISSSQPQQQLQQEEGWGHGVEGMQGQSGWGDSSSSPLQSPGSAAPTGSHLHSLASPKGDWPSGGFTSDTPPGRINSRNGSPVASPGLQQQQQQQWGNQEQGQKAILRQLRRLQPALGQPAQREWVMTCGPLPHIPTNSSSSVQHTAAGAKAAGATTQQQQQQRGWRLKPAVAAAVSAVSGGAVGDGGCVSGVSGIAGPSGPPVPPSRLYLQEADGEMRLAALLVSQQGL
jgi:hypothetical protein